MAKLRRRWVGLALLLLTLGILVLLPPARWRLIGWAKGEAFYRGRPTSYWAEEVADWNYRYCWRCIPPPTPPPPTWTDLFFQKLGVDRHRGDDAELLCQGDPAATEVLLALMGSDDGPIRADATRGLVKIGPQAEAILPVFIRALRDENVLVREAACEGLARFEAAAKPATQALIELYNNPKEYINVRMRAVEALRKISPSLAAKADAGELLRRYDEAK